jgi:hypothetical protein
MWFFKKRLAQLAQSQTDLDRIRDIILLKEQNRALEKRYDDIDLRLKVITYKVSKIKGEIPKSDETVYKDKDGEISPSPQSSETNKKPSIFLTPDGKLIQ